MAGKKEEKVGLVTLFWNDQREGKRKTHGRVKEK